MPQFKLPFRTCYSSCGKFAPSTQRKLYETKKNNAEMVSSLCPLLATPGVPLPESFGAVRGCASTTENHDGTLLVITRPFIFLPFS